MKKGLIKASLISFFLLSILGIVLFSLFSSAYSSEKIYNVGEGIHISLGEEGEYVLRVVSPEEEFVTKGIGDSIDYTPKEVGIYKFYISYNGQSEEYSFNVAGKNETSKQDIDENVTINATENYTGNYTSSELANEGYKIAEQVEIDKPVKWENQENASSEDQFTPAPQTKEEPNGELEKEVAVYSEENISYEDVLAHAEVEEVVKVGEEDKIKVYWEENNSYVDFEAKDKDNDRYIDEVQWIVPDLNKEQTFNIIIVTKAEHLSSDRSFISNIYEQVKALDDIWSETINSDEYVRITFEKNLTKDNDITIFPRVTSGNPIIEVYEKDKNELIAYFNSIKSNEYNKVLLTNLLGEQDTFDLKVIGGSIEFDYIVDPTFNKRTYNFGDYTNKTMYWGTPSNTFVWGGGTNASGANYTNIRAIDANYAKVCSTATTGNFELYERFNFTINEPLGSINWINITWKGNYSSNGEGANLYLFNQTSQNFINLSVISGAIKNYTVNYTTPYQISNLVGSNKQLVVYPRGENFDTGDCLYTDYVEVLVGYTDYNPQWFSNSTNSSATGSYVLHSLNWTDQFGLSGYVFEFDNGTGTFSNNSFVTLAGTQGWSNVSKWVNTSAGANIRWRVYVNDSANQWNSTSIFTYVTTDIIKPSFTTIPSNSSLFYANQSLLVTFVGADAGGFGYYRINDTRFFINQTGFLSNATSMAVGNYEINVTINDTSNNINWTRYKVQVNKSNYDCGVYFNATSPITYPDNFIAYTNCSSTYNLYQNGTSISNASTINSGASYYNLTVQRTDTTNYTNTVMSQFFTVNKNSENCQILFNETSPLESPKTFLVWANCTSPFTLYRNVTTISNNSEQALSISAYNFSFLRTDSSNYTSYYNETQMRIIDSISPSFTTIPPNSSLFYGNQSLLVTFAATDNSGFGYYSINDTRFSINQTGFLSNATPMAVGNYEINVTINDTVNNINWTRYNVQINKSNYFDCWVYFNATSPVTYPSNFIVYTNCSSNYNLYQNGTIISNVTTINSGAGYYNFTVQRTDTINYTNTFGTEFFSVNKNPEICQVLYNDSDPISYSNTFLVWANCTSPFTLYRNVTTISNNSEQALSISAYNFSFLRTDSSNYTSYYNETQIRVVDKTPPQVIINSPYNITYHNPLDFPIILNVSLNENGSAMYSIDDGLTNISLNTTDNKNFNGTLNLSIDGQYAFKVYANDTIGNNNYTEKVLFTATTGNILSQCGIINNSGTYILNQSITSTGSCLNITSSNVYIDCNGFAITYGTGGGSGVAGINASIIAYSNLSIKGCFITKASAAGTDGYGIYLNRTSNSTIFNNTIRTNGTANNYGVYISIDSYGNNITQNVILSKGTTINNFGIYLNRGATNTIVFFNNISTNGTATNYGIYAIGNSTSANNNNLFSDNNVTTWGIGASNYGIYITSNSSLNNVTNNNITARGTTTNYGIYLVGTAPLIINNNIISNNFVQTLGTTTNNYGIYLLTNANKNDVTNNTIGTSGTTGNIGIAISGATNASTGNELSHNTIRTLGTTTSYGIYLVGAAGALVNNNNTIDDNTIKTQCSAASSACHGIYLQNNANYNNITSNNISTNGTTTNYGIYLYGTAPLTVNNNLIASNVINTNGTGASNYGIYLLTNADQNDITNNTINTNGTTGNIGIAISGATNASLGNEISYNTIRTLGTTTANYGIYLLTNTSNNNVYENNISTGGTTTSYGIYLVGAAGTLVNNNSIDNNTIKTQCSAASSACHGIYLQNNANYNNITSNNISTNGTTTNHGIYLYGTAAINVDYNVIDSNNISTAGTGPSNYGIYLTTNTSNNNITRNNILANGTTTNYGIYLLGAAGGALVSNNIVSNNTLQVYGTAAAISNYGICIRNNANQNTLVNNNMAVYGTTGNYGIYLYGTAPLTVNNNLIASNVINTNGTGASNYGIYLLTNADQNDVTNNTINVTGTSGNVGIAISGATNASIGNELSYNKIMTLGRTSTNYGIYLTTNVSNNNITENNIFTNGTTTSYGAYLLGIANAPVDNNTFDKNTISTNCSAASSNCHGIYLQNNADLNNVTNNNIITHGTTANYGIYLFGTAALNLNLNLIDSNVISTDSPFDNGIYLSSYSNSTISSNIINVSKADRIVINSPTSNNNLTNNLFINKNYSYYDINFSSAGNNGTQLIDQYLENYTFTGLGGKINVKNSQYGQINFIVAVNKSGTNFSNDIKISNNFVYVNSVQTGLNKSANITLYNLPVNFANPIILKDGFACSVGACYNFTSLNAGNVSFNVSSWSNYSIVENLPELFINASSITINESNPIENQSVKISIIVENIGYGYAGNVLISFFEGDPFSSGINIGNTTINLSGFSSVQANISWNAKIGLNNIFVYADYNHLINESDEDNNEANNTFSVNAWQEIYGNTRVDKIIGNETSNLKKWFNESSLQGNVFITDSESYVNWLSLQAIGKTKEGETSSNDFSEIDGLLGMTKFEDSVSNMFSENKNPKNTQKIIVHKKEIQDVPIINSTNSSNFVTGILWDTSDDTTDGEFGPLDKEDLVFVAPINQPSEGAYGFYNYEIKIPSKLREYNTLDSQEIYLYYDLN